MKQYIDLVKYVLSNGEERSNRTGINTFSIFGHMFAHDLQSGFPLLTTKKMDILKIAGELRWFLDANTKPSELNSKIWDAWSFEDNIGPMYGSIWRKYPMIDGTSFDQVIALIDNIKKNPNSRRHIMTTLHLSCVADETVSPQENVKAGRGALWPCHGLITHCNVRNGKYLDLLMYQRSADLMLGVPFNIASYALLTHILAEETGLEVGELKIIFGDVHIYKNHIDGVNKQIMNEPKILPKLISKLKLDFKVEDVVLDRYDPYSPIKFEIAV